MFHQTLPANNAGRDFIVGDLHGCLALLTEQLAAVSFDPTRDRLLSVGDLVDRGPASFECLSLLLQPWFHAVIGNHEAMLLTWLGLRGSDYHSAGDFLYNGGEWALSLSAEQEALLRGPLAQALLEAPVVLSVEHARCPFHLVHAGLMDMRGSGRVLSDADVTEETVRRLYTHATWGRKLANDAQREIRERSQPLQTEGVALTGSPWEPDLSLTYSGHTILPRAVMHRSHVFLDRGAFRGGANSELMVLEHDRFVRGLESLGAL